MDRSESVGRTPQTDVDEHNVKPSDDYHRRSRRTNFIKEYLADYTSNSYLHGLKYIGEKQRSSVEKIFWLFMFICNVILCAVMIRNVWIKWAYSPVYAIFPADTWPVWQIPYPAVTVCLETKAMQSKFNYTNYYHMYYNFYNDTSINLTDSEKQHFEDLSTVCDEHLAPQQGSHFRNGSVIVDTIRNVSPTMDDVFYGCKWQDIPNNSCANLFSPMLTEDGQCYTFNTLGAQDLFRTENLHKEYIYLEYTNSTNTSYTSWALENGYNRNTPLETYPHRGLGFGVKTGLTFVLRGKTLDLDYLCKGPVQGFKILLHNPAELPRPSQQYFRTPLSQEVVVVVKPNVMTTTDGLRLLDPALRLCYFSSERYLLYYKVYTQANCEMECLTNFTNARCGCVHFGMPHGPDMKVCSAGKMACIKQAKMELATWTAIEEADDLGAAREVAMQCRCQPSCYSIEYEAETSQADYDWHAIYRGYRANITEDMDDVYFARVMVFFKEAEFPLSRRSELPGCYGLADFLANCGGLLGLFMGFSILSVAEILYFLTLRLCCIFYKRREAKKKGVQDIPVEGKEVSPANFLS